MNLYEPEIEFENIVVELFAFLILQSVWNVFKLI